MMADLFQKIPTTFLESHALLCFLTRAGGYLLGDYGDGQIRLRLSGISIKRFVMDGCFISTRRNVKLYYMKWRGVGCPWLAPWAPLF